MRTTRPLVPKDGFANPIKHGHLYHIYMESTATGSLTTGVKLVSIPRRGPQRQGQNPVLSAISKHGNLEPQLQVQLLSKLPQPC